jgi:hypothetical protein
MFTRDRLLSGKMTAIDTTWDTPTAQMNVFMLLRGEQLSTDPADSLCRLNHLITKLNRELRDCSKEDKQEIHEICVEIRQQSNLIKNWALTTIE